ncbi:hypothetical protein TRFO_24372 [Tritrichomonas foetus]|uniref:Leucine Rich Repeat family protein n=1 Tax=Tritrichomonas foetus TaxID=1144522 RepID=A0A1J4KCK2_9EUKA|nr:hypothetical protein TRFO_24372 [Tritrichomonas foetus]|eukprot:OHT07420.1 hypothetical protein TRFO_24372 [Tritrichomonas foetus]
MSARKGSKHFIPSSIRSSTNKAIKYLTQQINPKVEPLIFSDWCKKAGKNRNTDAQQLRFCAVTPSAFYICKQAIISFIKISQIFAWVDIKSISINPNSNEVRLSFGTGEISLLFENRYDFTGKLVSYLRPILPDPYFPIDLNLPQSIEIQPTPFKSIHFADIFLSKCKLLNESVDADMILNLKHNIRHRKPIVIDSNLLNEQKTNALCYALTYSPTIKSAKFGGKSFNQLFARVSLIVTLNPGLRDIEIFKHKNTKDFEKFVISLKDSKVETLRFTDVEFTQKISEFLSDNLSESPIKSLYFNGQQFARNCIQCFHEKSIETLQHLSIENESLSTIHTFHIISVCLSSCLTKLVINNSNFDIATFFEAVNSNANDLKLKRIDLSGNRCSANFSGDYSMPSTLCKIKLTQLTWEGNSIVSFLSKQSYLTMVDIDLSRAYLSSSQVNSMSQTLPREPKSTSIRAFKWNSNPIFVKFFNFIMKWKFLTKLVMNDCEYSPKEKNQILPSLSGLISSINIQKLSIRNIQSTLGTKLMLSLKDCLCEHQAIKHLDISNNSIGDDGLSILKEIITVNTRIRSICFDGCKLQMYSSLSTFLAYITQIPYIRNVSKPRNDISELVKKFGQPASKEIKKNWVKLKEKHHRNHHHHKHHRSENSSSDFTSSTYTDTTSITTTSTLISSLNIITDQNIENEKELTALDEVEWEMMIDLFDGGVNKEWEKLRKQYSYVNITGIKALEPIEKECPIFDFVM